MNRVSKLAASTAVVAVCGAVAFAGPASADTPRPIFAPQPAPAAQHVPKSGVAKVEVIWRLSALGDNIIQFGKYPEGYDVLFKAVPGYTSFPVQKSVEGTIGGKQKITANDCGLDASTTVLKCRIPNAAGGQVNINGDLKFAPLVHSEGLPTTKVSAESIVYTGFPGTPVVVSQVTSYTVEVS